MLLLQFFGQNLHFAINLFVSLVCGAISWLYFDTWVGHKEPKELLKWVGYLILSFAFLISGTVVDGSELVKPIFGGVTIYLSLLFKVVGFSVLAIGLKIDPMPQVIKNEGLILDEYHNEPESVSKHKTGKKQQNSIFGSVISIGLQFIAPIASAIVGWLYWQRASKGLERHLKPVAIGFFIITISQVISITSIFKSSDNPIIFNAVASYGFIWYLHHLLLLLGAIFLGRWVWSYLVKRIFSQLFMVFISIIVVVFLVTTVTFSYLLIRNIQSDTLNTLESAANSLGYAINSKQQETLAGAEVISQNSKVIQGINTKDHKLLVEVSGVYLTSKKLSTIIVTNDSGQVLARAEDPAKWGDSLSDEAMVQRAITGLSSSSIVTKQDVIAPVVLFWSSVPVRDNGRIIGTIVVGITADNAFVDGIKKATGLDSTVYSGNIRSATTLIAPDGKTRWVGIKEVNKRVNEQVLNKSGTFKGSLNILNQPYLAVYTPLKDIDNSVVGMIFVGRAQNYVLNTASRSIELTFIITAILLVLSILPAYFVARFITRQIH